MNATRQLHDLGQRLWLDNITRGLLDSGELARYIKELSVTGLTSNPTIFDRAISGNDFYDEAIRTKASAGRSGEELFFELALEDLTRAADLFRPAHDASGGRDLGERLGAILKLETLLVEIVNQTKDAAGLNDKDN